MLPKLLPHLVGPVALLAAGLGWQALLPRPLERSRAARAGFGYLIGAAWVALAAWALGHVAGARLSRELFLGLALAPALAGSVAALRRRAKRSRRPSGPAVRRRHAWAVWVAAAFGTVVSLALVADAVTEPVRDFDGRMTWGTAARYLAADGRTTPAAFSDEAAFVVHPRYPIGLPILRAAAVELGGRGFGSFAERPLYALFLPALLLALWPTLSRSFGRRAGLLALLLVGSAPVLLWDFDTGPRSTYSDFPLAAFLGGAVVAWLHPAIRREAWRGGVAGLLLAAVVASKNEGLLLAPLALCVFATVGGGRRAGRALAAATTAVVAALSLVLHWRSGIPNRNDEGYFALADPMSVLRGLGERALPALAGGGERLLVTKRFGLLFWWLPLGLSWTPWARPSRAARVAVALLGLQLGLVLTAYAVAPKDVLAATWDRFVIQQTAALALLTAWAIRSAWPRARRPGSVRSPDQNASLSSPPQKVPAGFS